MKRLLVAAMAATAMLSFARADGTAVAKIGDAEYTDLKTAFAAAQDGDTVTLLSDYAASATAVNNHDVTLDLGGFTVTCAEGFNDYLFDNEAGTLTISNGTATAALVLCANGGTVDLEDGAVINASEWDGFGFIGASVAIVGTNAVVNGTGTGFDDNEVPRLSFNCHDSATVNIFGTVTKVSTEQCAIYMDSADATINVYDGAVVTSKADALRPDAGTINMYGGTLTGGDGYETIYAWADTGVSINIYGGDIVSLDDPPTPVGAHKECCVLGADCKARFNGIDYNSSYGKLGVADLCAPGYAPVLGDDGWYTIQEAAVPVAKIGDKTFATLADAFAAAQDGDTVELLGDVELAETLAIADVNAKLDLGGFILKGAAGFTDNLMTVTNSLFEITNGTVNVAGNAMRFRTDATVKIAADTVIREAGTYKFEVEGGTLDFYGEISNTQSEVPAIHTATSGSTINIYDGAIVTSNGDTIRSNPTSGIATINIYGGTFTPGSGYPTFYSYKACVSTFNVYGGILNHPQTDAKQCVFGLKDSAVVTPLTDACEAKFGSAEASGWSVNRTLADWCAAGFEPVLGEDGYYTIQKAPVAKIGDVTFKTLGEAFAAAQAGDTVELVGDAAVDATIVPTVAVTLDLAGKTLSSSGAATLFDTAVALTITNGVASLGTAMFINMTDGANVAVNDVVVSGSSDPIFYAAVGGSKTLTIGKGTVVTVAGNSWFDFRDTTLNLYGSVKNLGNEKGNGAACWPCAGVNVVNIYEGASMVSEGEDFFRNNRGQVTYNIYGGTFYCKKDAIFYSYYKAKNGTESPVFNIYGGTFESATFYKTTAAAEFVEPIVTALDDTCQAKFKSNGFGAGYTLADFCASGYEPVKGEDGYYTIQAKAAPAPVPVKDLPEDISDEDAAKLEATAAALVNAGVDAADIKAATAAAKAGSALTSAQQQIINSLLLGSEKLVSEEAKVEASIEIVDGEVTVKVEGVNCELPAKTTIGYLTVKHADSPSGEFKAVQRITVTNDGVGETEPMAMDGAGFYKSEFEWNKPAFETPAE